MSTKVIMNDAFFKKGFLISTEKTLLDINTIHQYLSKESYWGKGVSQQLVEKSVQNSLCFGVYLQQKQVGFARVVTDFATFAYVCDVFILSDYRKTGLSKWLIQTIRNYPDLQNLRRWLLATADAHGLYGQFGFITLKNHDRWMEIFNPTIQPEEVA